MAHPMLRTVLTAAFTALALSVAAQEAPPPGWGKPADDKAAEDKAVGETAAEDKAVEAAREKYRSGDYAEGFREIFPYARRGNASAQNVVGNAYFYGNGVVQDCKLALKWTRAAAEQHLDRAMMNLGQYYNLGCFGDGIDAAEARDWLQKAVDAGFAPANGRLARLLASGRLGPPDVAAIQGLLDAGVAADDTDAKLALAEMQFAGDVLPRDQAAAAEAVRALTYGTRGGDQWLALARFHLAGIDGDAPDPVAAEAILHWLIGAGHWLAAPDYARLLIEGGGYWHDPVEGWATCLWAERKASADYSGAIAAACQPLRAQLESKDVMRAALIAARRK